MFDGDNEEDWETSLEGAEGVIEPYEEEGPCAWRGVHKTERCPDCKSNLFIIKPRSMETFLSQLDPKKLMAPEDGDGVVKFEVTISDMIRECYICRRTIAEMGETRVNVYLSQEDSDGSGWQLGRPDDTD